MANWEAILRWSLRHHDGTSQEPQMDEERRRWLQEALQAVAAAPTENQLLQAAITVLRAHMPAGVGQGQGQGEIGEEEEKNLLKAFEEIQYLIEDLDHANNLLPMNGVEVIASYLHHTKPSLVQCACELIATATQNNPKTQQAFQPTLPQLLTIINNRDIPSSVNIKALYAVSCKGYTNTGITRDSESGVAELLTLDGLASVRQCLAAEEVKLVVKTLFMLMSYYSTSQGEVKDKLVSELPSLVPELVSLVKTGMKDEVKGHALSALVTMVTHHQVAVVECRKEELGLQGVLSQLTHSLSPEDHEEELAHVKTLRDVCFS